MKLQMTEDQLDALEAAAELDPTQWPIIIETICATGLRSGQRATDLAQLVLLRHLATAYSRDHGRTGVEVRFTQADETFEAISPPQPFSIPDAELAIIKQNHGNVWLDRYAQTQSDAAYGRAEALQREALELYRAAGAAGSTAQVAGNLAALAGLRHRYTGERSALELALRAGKEAVTALQDLGDEWASDLAGAYTNLGIAHWNAYEESGRAEHAQAAEGNLTACVDLAASDDSTRIALSALGNLFTSLYERHGELDHASQAESALVDYLELCDPVALPVEHGLALLGLANLHRTRFVREFDQAAGAQAANSYRDLRDFAISSRNRGLLAQADINLATVIADLVERVGPADDTVREVLASADEWCREAISVYQSTSALTGLARARLTHADVLALLGRMDEAERLTAAVLSQYPSTPLPPAFQLRAAVRLVHWRWGRDDHAGVVDACDAVESALSELAERQVLRRDSQAWVREVKGVASRNALARLRLGDALGAAVALERGRARILRSALERDRIDLERLDREHPDLAEAYREAASLLGKCEREAVDDVQLDGGDLATVVAARARFDTILKAIRDQPDFNRFLEPPGFEGVRMRIPAAAPLAYLGVTDKAGFFILVGPDGEPETYETDICTSTLLGQCLDAWQAALRAPAEGNSSFYEGPGMAAFGAQLVRPLAAALAARGAGGVQLCPVGPLTVLPLHAAPWQDGAKAVALVDEFDVSYLPTASALVTGGLSSGNWASVVVADPAEPHAALTRLLGTTAADLFTPSSVLTGEDATPGQVVAALSNASPRLAVFACHGMYDPQAALDSGLELLGGRLTMRRLLQDVHLAQTDVVVLSACKSGLVDWSDLPEEWIGLPAAFLELGARWVIGTSDSVQVFPTLLVMRSLLRSLRDSVPPATALRSAVLELKEMSSCHRDQALGELDGDDLGLNELMAAHSTRGEDGPTPFAGPRWWAPFVCLGPIQEIGVEEPVGSE